jgi:guanylate kinase
MKAPLIIVSGASGSGKSTVVGRVLREAGLPLRLSVSVTTRKERPGELNGVHYHFWNKEQFGEALAAGRFLEHAEVHGNYYGTLWSEVEPFREQGIGVILEIDVQGAATVRQKCPDNVSVFIHALAGTIEKELTEVQKRLESRGTETPEAVQRRVAGARAELERASDYDFVVINDDLDAAVSRLTAIIREELNDAR